MVFWLRLLRPLPATRIDDWMGVEPGWALVFAICLPIAALNVFLILSLFFCPLCMQTIFAVLRLIELLW